MSATFEPFLILDLARELVPSSLTLLSRLVFLPPSLASPHLLIFLTTFIQRSSVISRPRDVTDIAIDPNTRIQVVDEIAHLAGARKHQFAAFVRSEACLVVWSDEVDTIMESAEALELRMIQYVWISTAHGKVRDMEGGQKADNTTDGGEGGSFLTDGATNGGRTEKGVEGGLEGEGQEEGADYDQEKTMGIAGWTEAQREKRPVMLFAPLITALAICLNMLFVGSGVREFSFAFPASSSSLLLPLLLSHELISLLLHSQRFLSSQANSSKSLFLMETGLDSLSLLRRRSLSCWPWFVLLVLLLPPSLSLSPSPCPHIAESRLLHSLTPALLPPLTVLLHLCNGKHLASHRSHRSLSPELVLLLRNCSSSVPQEQTASLHCPDACLQGSSNAQLSFSLPFSPRSRRKREMTGFSLPLPIHRRVSKPLSFLPSNPSKKLSLRESLPSLLRTRLRLQFDATNAHLFFPLFLSLPQLRTSRRDRFDLDL